MIRIYNFILPNLTTVCDNSIAQKIVAKTRKEDLVDGDGFQKNSFGS